jgi:hypothetical protein
LKSVSDNIDLSSVLSSKPLVQCIGEDLHSVLVILDDSSNFECVIPHCLMKKELFSFHLMAVFRQDSICKWKVKDTYLCKDVSYSDKIILEEVNLDSDDSFEKLSLTKDQKEDVMLLAKKVMEKLPDCESCIWY